jgi:hypothetical protein
MFYAKAAHISIAEVFVPSSLQVLSVAWILSISIEDDCVSIWNASEPKEGMRFQTETLSIPISIMMIISIQRNHAIKSSYQFGAIFASGAGRDKKIHKSIYRPSDFRSHRDNLASITLIL